MMHRCSMVGPCSCDLFHSQNNSSFSMLFSMPNHKSFDEESMYPSSVDCTLSLGTPSTRLTEDDDGGNRRGNNHRVANFCSWEYLHQSKNSSPYHSQKSGRGSNGGSNGNGNGGSDPLLARRCANCDTTSTPLWRNGPRGPKSLCNACGIRFKKEERRATAAGTNNVGATASGMMEPHHTAYHYAQPQKMPCYSPAANEFRFIDENDRDFLSWRLNVPDRPTSLVHDFTRY